LKFDSILNISAKIIRRSSSDDRNRTYRIPIINITKPKYESDSDSYSSKFGALDDDVFYGGNGEDKNLNQQKTTDNSNISADNILSALETHTLRRLKILKVKLQKCRICEETVYFRGYKCFRVRKLTLYKVLLRIISFSNIGSVLLELIIFLLFND